MGSFFSRLSYSFGNEDWSTEQKALKIQPSDRVVCITASGDRPLHLLLDESQEIIALDANPIQNFLLELKVAAMQQLSHEEYLSFLGAAPGKNRLDTLKRLSNHLSPGAAEYWKRHKKRINAGVLYQGAIERRVILLARFVCFLRGNMIKKLFEINNIEEQKAFVAKEWHRGWWKKLIVAALSPKCAKLILKDPGLYAHKDPSIVAGKYIYDRLSEGLTKNIAKESIFISLFLKGKVEKEAFPPYLTADGFNTIKPRLKGIKSHTADLLSYLEAAPPNHFDCFSLSDVASYISSEDFKRLTYAVYRTAKPGARFCFREFLSKHQIPEGLRPLFIRDKALEENLEKEDRCYVYRFMVGHISKP